MDTAEKTISHDLADDNVTTAPSGSVVMITTHASWEQPVIPPQEVGDPGARQRAREAGRRAVRKYGEALSKLSE